MSGSHSGPRVDIVVTSIGDGRFIPEYADLIRRTDAAETARLVVVPDRKTPRALYDEGRRAADAGVSIVLPTLDEQDALLARLGEPSFIPYDSDNRRNVGFLLAWLGGADYVVSIDDDNLPAGDDFLRKHAIVTSDPHEHTVVGCPTGWFNPCELLEIEPSGAAVFPRGFPYGSRERDRPAHVERRRRRVRINAGLWLGDPDVDAITRLALAPQSSALRDGGVVLDDDTWAPVNSQNTAIHRDALPAYYFVRMGYPFAGGAVDRFGDIFSGYFVQACAKHLGDGVRFGDPATRHLRNDHALLRDLRQELPAILVVEHLVDRLRELRLDGSTYLDAYRSLSYAVEDAAEELGRSPAGPEATGFLRETAGLMRRWADLLERAAP